MRKTIKLLTALSLIAISGGAQAKFTVTECNRIWNCCRDYRDDDDLVSGYDECCMDYDGYDIDDWTACTKVCAQGNSIQYCDLGSEITSCQPGEGYDSFSNACTKCPSGEYSIYETLESGYDETLLIPNYYCEPCSGFWAGGTKYISPSSTVGSTSETLCYISKNKTWEFSDESGKGEQSFTDNCYYKN